MAVRISALGRRLVAACQPPAKEPEGRGDYDTGEKERKAVCQVG